ncbi:MAG TPA: hypothetical protein VHM02_01560, partial [Thermoanaerobaculia bacterium]|nr:hypothetical protein [Thermoanaerobaculia bacterium]
AAREALEAALGRVGEAEGEGEVRREVEMALAGMGGGVPGGRIAAPAATRLERPPDGRDAFPTHHHRPQPGAE